MSFFEARGSDSCRPTIVGWRGDLMRCGVIVTPAAVLSGSACPIKRASFNVGDASRSNLRTCAETFPWFSERIFWTDGRPDSGIRKWSRWRLKTSPLVHWCWLFSGVRNMAAVSREGAGRLDSGFGCPPVLKFSASFITEPLRVGRRGSISSSSAVSSARVSGSLGFDARGVSSTLGGSKKKKKH